jgi:hypothetical protein
MCPPHTLEAIFHCFAPYFPRIASSSAPTQHIASHHLSTHPNTQLSNNPHSTISQILTNYQYSNNHYTPQMPSLFSRPSAKDVTLLSVLGILCVAFKLISPSTAAGNCMILNLCLIVVMLPVWRENIRLERALRRERGRSDSGWAED